MHQKIETKMHYRRRSNPTMKAIFVVIAIHVLRLSHYQDNSYVVLFALGINTTGTNNRNIDIVRASSTSQKRQRALPENIIVGYTTHCTEKVVKAVREGVNVVIWSFVEIRIDDDEEYTDTTMKNSDLKAECVSSFDRDCAKQMINQLDSEGYNDTVHLVSFGGWNGPHLPDKLDVYDMYRAFQDKYGDIFHGIDWDLEGDTRLDSPTNYFTIDCLENMGRFSQVASEDGYIVSMAPPQSYLDIQTNGFSRYVNLTDTSKVRDGWHNDFHYFGLNVFSYLLSKYGKYIDFVSIQFYESYSRAGLDIYHKQMNPEEYLTSYVKDLVLNKKESFLVEFEQDPLLNYPSHQVSFPLSKLVFGFSNGWAAVSSNDKVVYMNPAQIEAAYKSLLDINLAPRGFMFWVIDEEGKNGVNFARSLNDILRIRRIKKHQYDDGEFSSGEKIVS